MKRFERISNYIAKLKIDIAGVNLQEKISFLREKFFVDQDNLEESWAIALLIKELDLEEKTGDLIQEIIEICNKMYYKAEIGDKNALNVIFENTPKTDELRILIKEQLSLRFLDFFEIETGDDSPILDQIIASKPTLYVLRRLKDESWLSREQRGLLQEFILAEQKLWLTAKKNVDFRRKIARRLEIRKRPRSFQNNIGLHIACSLWKSTFKGNASIVETSSVDTLISFIKGTPEKMKVSHRAELKLIGESLLVFEKISKEIHESIFIISAQSMLEKIKSVVNLQKAKALWEEIKLMEKISDVVLKRFLSKMYQLPRLRENASLLLDMYGYCKDRTFRIGKLINRINQFFPSLLIDKLRVLCELYSKLELTHDHDDYKKIIGKPILAIIDTMGQGSYEKKFFGSISLILVRDFKCVSDEILIDIMKRLAKKM